MKFGARILSRLWLILFLATGSLLALGEVTTVSTGDWKIYERARDCSVFRTVSEDAERLVAMKKNSIQSLDRDGMELRTAFEKCGKDNGVSMDGYVEADVVAAQLCPVEFEAWIKHSSSILIATQDLESARQGLDFVARQISFYCGKLPRRSAQAAPPTAF